MAKLDDIVAFLDRELRVNKFTDSSHNGLQVANRGTVRRVCCGVDASLEFFEAAQRKGRRVSVVSTIRTQPPMVADDLRPMPAICRWTPTRGTAITP